MISIHALREESDAALLLLTTVAHYFNPRPPRGGRHRFVVKFQADVLISIHALREEGDKRSRGQTCRMSDFNPRPPLVGRPDVLWFAVGPCNISIHALREEGDSSSVPFLYLLTDFNPRPPRGGRLFSGPVMLLPYQFQSTPSARRATKEERLRANLSQISIHALREEGDMLLWWAPSGMKNFNPRPPRGGRPIARHCLASTTKFQSTPSARRATVRLPVPVTQEVFQSTPSARRATWMPPARASSPRRISIHALREEGDACFGSNHPNLLLISIHALREEGDGSTTSTSGAFTIFQSTPSARRATLQCLVTWSSHRYFNPRPPRGGRLKGRVSAPRDLLFQSTPSARRATAKAAKNPPRLFHYTHLCTI